MKTNDLIDRQAAIDVLATMQGLCTSKAALIHNSKIWQQIKNLPSAQTEIIRCKDCKHHHRDNSGAYYCGRKEYGYGWGLNDFCSDAERRTDEGD